MSLALLGKITIAGAAGSQMVKVRLGLRQRHPTGRDGRDNFSAGTTHALGIWKLLEQPATERGQNVLLFLCGVCLFAQKRLTLREFNSLIHQGSTKIILRIISLNSLASSPLPNSDESFPVRTEISFSPSAPSSPNASKYPSMSTHIAALAILFASIHPCG